MVQSRIARPIPVGLARNASMVTCFSETSVLPYNDDDSRKIYIAYE